MGANWPPGSKNRNWGNILILSVRKVVFWVRGIFVCIFPQLLLQRYSRQQMWHLSHSRLQKWFEQLLCRCWALLADLQSYNRSLVPSTSLLWWNLVASWAETAGGKAPVLPLLVSSRTVLCLNGRYFPTDSFIALSVSGLISSEGSGRIKLTSANSVLVWGTR